MYAKQAFLHTSPTKTGGMYAKLPFLHTHSPNTQCAVNTLSSNWTGSHTAASIFKKNHYLCTELIHKEL
jgi:hypothetical protein